ncbi:hypothetical protein EVAR_66833_1 [Eumeta japonica]|uniref:Uncharacterized protein n=1 Tax=Eumeta variegata TaxID=151549 RepID=A0A4C2ABT9_EUMVA|nr:hypothetical protein EVAR_66833_1 [Eumeta japonica]
MPGPELKRKRDWDCRHERSPRKIKDYIRVRSSRRKRPTVIKIRSDECLATGLGCIRARARRVGRAAAALSVIYRMENPFVPSESAALLMAVFRPVADVRTRGFNYFRPIYEWPLKERPLAPRRPDITVHGS